MPNGEQYGQSLAGELRRSLKQVELDRTLEETREAALPLVPHPGRSTLPSLPVAIDRLGSRSSWAGQRAIQQRPVLRPPRALAMISAVMAHLAIIIRLAGFAGVVRRFGQFSPRPFGQDGKEASDVLDDLPGVLATKIAIMTRLPRLNGTVDQVIVCCV